MGAAVTVSLGGAGAVLWGLSSFLSKVWVERILEKDRHKYSALLEEVRAEHDRATRRLQAGLEHAVYVSRAQFEVELAALREIWESIAEVRSRIVGLRPSGHFEPKVTDQDGALADFVQRRQAFVDAHLALVKAVDKQSPFVPVGIYSVVDALCLRSTQEKIQIEREKPFESDWYDRGDKAIAEVMALADDVSDRIRQRMASLVVSGERP